MTRDKLVFNEKALKALRKHPAVIRDLEKRARRIAAAAGGEDMGYKVTVLELEDPRGAVSVMATGRAAAHNRKHNSLMKAIDAGR